MYTTQSKMISRAIWVEKKHVWKINLQKNGVRKSFYSSVPGDKGRKICAQNATSWLSGACPFSVSERTTVDTVFERYLQDKALETTNILFPKVKLTFAWEENKVALMDDEVVLHYEVYRYGELAESKSAIAGKTHWQYNGSLKKNVVLHAPRR